MLRLIGIGLLAFLLAGVAILLSNSAELRLLLRQSAELVRGPQLHFEAVREAPLARGQHTATVLRTGQDSPIILSGFPAYQSATFRMPIDTRPISGSLRIDMTSQLLAGARGLLRVSIGGRKRGEILLRAGESRRSLEIDLHATEVASDELVVSFSLLGKGTATSCNADSGYDAIIEIESTSAVHVTLERPLDTARDLVRSQGQWMPLAWDDDPARRVSSLLAGAAWAKTGFSVAFVNAKSALTPDAALATTTLSERPDFAWSDVMADESALFRLRRFRQNHTWRIQYDMEAGRERNLPDRLQLDMELGRQASGDHWQLAVILNDRLLDHVLVPADADNVTADIPLPAAFHRRFNAIEIIATSTNATSGECELGPELFASISPRTRLIAGTDHLSGPLVDLRERLARQPGWELTVDERLSGTDAQIIADLLAPVLPDAPAFGPAWKPLTMHAIAAGSERPPNSADRWLLTPGTASDSAQLRAIPQQDVFRAAEVAIIIEMGARDP